MQEPEYKTQIKSQYNEATNQISRLDNIWRSCHNYRQRGLLTLWNIQLDSAWSELAGDEKLIKPEHEKKYNILNKLIVKYFKDRSKLYQVLLKKEIFLRRLQNEQGKGTKYDDTSSEDFE